MERKLEGRFGPAIHAPFSVPLINNFSAELLKIKETFFHPCPFCEKVK
jgi:hypothetical protein